MTDFYNGQIIDILPDNIKCDPIVISISYAISNMVKKIVDYADKSGIYASVDVLNEEILNLLAVELRTKYYGNWLSVEEKRAIVKKTLLWYCKAGTLYTVQELTNFVFQSAYIEEWFQYAASPFLFRLIVNVVSQDVTAEKYIKFLQAIKEVKNTRSHLEKVVFKYCKKVNVRTAAACGVGNLIKVKTGIIKSITDMEESKPASVLFVKQNILAKTESVKENEIYTVMEDGTKVRVFSQNGNIIKII